MFKIAILCGMSSYKLLRACRMMTDHEVQLINDNMMEFYVSFKGPKDSKCSFSLVWVHRHHRRHARCMKSPPVAAHLQKCADFIVPRL